MLHRPGRVLLAAALAAGLATTGLAAGSAAAQSSAPGTTAPAATPAATPAAAPPIDYQPVPPGYDPAADSLGSTLEDHPEAAEPGATARVSADAQVSASAVPGQPLGLDVSSYQPGIIWSQVAANGAKFAYVKATQGSPGAGSYTNPEFSDQYTGSYAAGLIRGAYHFATPNLSSGAAQATFFVNNGGGWSADGRTLPPMLDIEFNPYGQTCYNLSPAQLQGWITDFSNTVNRLTGRYPTIYTNTYWWNQCVGAGGSFGQNNPLFVASYFSTPYGPTPGIPSQWPFYSIWQWSDKGVFPGDQDIFNGTYDQLVAFARGSAGGGPVVTPPPTTTPPAPAPDFFTTLLNLLIQFFRSLGFPV